MIKIAKSKYQSHVRPYFKWIEKAKKKGYSDEKIMQKLDISKTAFYSYQEKHKEFKDLLENARVDFLDEVEDALYKLAIGYDYEEVSETIKSASGFPDEVTIRKTKKHVQADFKAIQFILRNRTSYWSNREEIERELTKLQKYKIEKEVDLLQSKLDFINGTHENENIGKIIEAFKGID